MEKESKRIVFFSPSIITGLPGQVLYLAACKRLSCAFVFLSKPLQTPGWCILRPTSRFDLPFPFFFPFHFCEEQINGMKMACVSILGDYFHLLPHEGHMKILGFTFSFKPKMHLMLPKSEAASFLLLWTMP